MRIDVAPWSPPPQRIAVFRALQLGDLLCAVPALRALRAGAPGSSITLIGLPWAAEFARRFSRYVDDFLPFPGFPGFPERDAPAQALIDFLRAARERDLDLVVQLHGSGAFSNPLVRLIRPRRLAGFFEADGFCPDRSTFVPWPEEGSEILRLASLVTALGLPACGSDLEWPLGAADWTEWELLSARLSLGRDPYVCIHPGARLRSRRWPLERFADVGRALAARGWRVVVTGVADEAALAEELARRVGGDAASVAGSTTLGSLAALIRKSALVVCNDTGISHMAAALGVPSVVVASGSDARRWAPLDRDLHRVLAYDVPCRPCGYDLCPFGHPCALGVGVDDVLREARAVLQKALRHAA
jgi:ADP-heptose:LPS heptosyltransferase